MQLAILVVVQNCEALLWQITQAHLPRIRLFIHCAIGNKSYLLIVHNFDLDNHLDFVYFQELFGDFLRHVCVEIDVDAHAFSVRLQIYQDSCFCLVQSCLVFWAVVLGSNHDLDSTGAFACAAILGLFVED